MAVLRSGNTENHLTVDPTSNAARALVYTSGGHEITQRHEATFMATSSNTTASGEFAPVAAATTIIQIPGSPSHRVRVASFVINTTNTNLDSLQIQLIKRVGATIPGAGGKTTIGVPMDYSNSAPTTSVMFFTAAPTSVGSQIGVINTVRVHSAQTVPVAGVTALASNHDGVELLPRINGQLMPITLLGTDEVLEVLLAGVALSAGQKHSFRVVWTEDIP